MIYLIAGQAALNAAVIVAALVLLFRYLRERDRRQSEEIQVWANRIQAPDVAVMQTLPNEPELNKLHVTLDDDAEYEKAITEARREAQAALVALGEDE